MRLIAHLLLTLFVIGAMSACSDPPGPVPVDVPCGGACPIDECQFGTCIGGPEPDVPVVDEDTGDEGCEADGECDQGEICQAGECVVGCRDDAGCQEGQECVEGQCVSGTCRIDNDCGAGEICLEEACVAGCRNDGGCAEGEICLELACVAGCRLDEQCEDGLACVDNACVVPPCLNDTECEDGFICEAEVCTAGCRRDRDCPEGQICEELQCVVQGCAEDGDCDPGFICQDDRCEEGCRDDKGCPEGESCLENACVVGCLDDGACAEGEICEGEVCVAGCRRDAQCGEDEICEGSECQAGCRVDGDCPDVQVCVALACVSGCRDDLICDPGQICLDRLCGAGCRNDGGCAQGQICLEDICAQGCRNDAGCAPGSFCDIGEGQLTGACEVGCRLGDCEQGEVCNVETRACDVIPCEGDGECQPGQICVGGACAAGCRGDEGCGLGEICRGEVCVIGCRLDAQCGLLRLCEEETCVDGCRDNEGCPPLQVCREAQCVGGCRGDGDCQQGSFCDVEGAVCVAGCRQDVDCPGDDICIGTQCVPGCRDSIECELLESCVENACVPRPCVRDDHCPNLTLCNDGFCGFGCTRDDQCTNSKICIEGGCRTGCRDDGSCFGDQFCDLDALACTPGCQPGRCPLGQICEIADRVCVPEPCQGDGQCPEGFYCDGVCTEGCRGDEECGGGQICDDGTRQCTPGCRSDEGCPVDQFCDLNGGNQGVCGIGCRQRQCPEFQICDEDSRQCVNGDMCFGDQDCGEGRICEPFFCQEGCRQDGDCLEGQVCNEELFCSTGCRADGDCRLGLYCDQDESACVTGCRQDSECAQGQSCVNIAIGDGISRQRCVATPCGENTDCAEGFFCDTRLGACAEGCRDNQECPIGQICDQDDHACAPPPCRSDDTCGQGEICLDGLCGTGCRADTTCPAPFYCDIEFGQASGQCEPGCRVGRCDPGKVCDTRSRTCQSQGCGGDVDCANDEYCRDGVECVVGCRNDAGCEQGSICLDDRRVCVQGCREDGDGNDVCQDAVADVQVLEYRVSAQPFGDGTQICLGGDRDHVAVELAQGDRLEVEVLSDGPMLAEVRRGDCQTVEAETVEDGGRQLVTFTAPFDGAFVVRVRAALDTDTAPYALTLTRQEPACGEDFFEGRSLEPNNNTVQAKLLPNVRGVPLKLDAAMCAGDEDWVKVTVEQFGDRLHAVLTQDEGAIPLEIEIYHPNGVTRMAQARGTGSVKVASTVALGDPGAYFVRVLSSRPVGEGRGVPYNLRLLVNDTGCAPDAFENNDAIEAAALLGAGQSFAGICQVDAEQDWYKVLLLPGDIVNVTLIYDHSLLDGAPQLPVTLFGPGGERDERDFLVRVPNTDIDRLSLNPNGFTVREDQGGEWFLEVGSAFGANEVPYVVNIQIERTQCVEDIELPSNEDCAQALALAQGQPINGFVCGPALDEDWYAVNVVGGQVGRLLVVELSHFHFNGNLDMEVYHPDGETLAGFSYSINDGELVEFDTTDPGPHCVRVFTNSAQVQNRYTLQAQIR